MVKLLAMGHVNEATIGYGQLSCQAVQAYWISCDGHR